MKNFTAIWLSFLQGLLDKIFKPSFTAKPTGQGTGLWLSLSYDIVKAHGGEIRVETEEREY
jgi:two-component system NtrC family sensor kinase